MPKKRFKPNHLELRYKTYFALLTVPKDVRHIIGKSKFFETTNTHDLRIAESQAALKIIKWKAAIAEARCKTDDPILNSAIELHRMMRSGDSPRQLVKEVIEDEAIRIEYKKGALASENFVQVASGKTKVLATLLPDWKEHQIRRGLKEKTIAQMYKDIDIMTITLSTTFVLTDHHATQWIRYIAGLANLTPSVVTRIIRSCRNFFQYLKDIEIVSEQSIQPFTIPKEFRVSKNPQSKAINKVEPWEPFSAEQSTALYAEAVKNGDQILADLIYLACYTGTRIEEICSLEKTEVNLGKKSFKIKDAKTRAGLREIPIHSAILPLITNMMANDSKYLIPDLTLSKYGKRSNAIGKRFGRMKTKLGYKKSYVFHSFRKTFTTELENSGVTENITADIIGHKKPTMTYGAYSGGTTLEVKRNAIEQINYGPDFCIAKNNRNTSKSF